MTPRHARSETPQQGKPPISAETLKWIAIGVLILSGLDLRPVNAQPSPVAAAGQPADYR